MCFQSQVKRHLLERIDDYLQRFHVNNSIDFLLFFSPPSLSLFYIRISICSRKRSRNRGTIQSWNWQMLEHNTPALCKPIIPRQFLTSALNPPCITTVSRWKKKYIIILPHQTLLLNIISFVNSLDLFHFRTGITMTWDRAVVFLVRLTIRRCH